MSYCLEFSTTSKSYAAPENSPVSNSSRPLKRSTEDSFIPFSLDLRLIYSQTPVRTRTVYNCFNVLKYGNVVVTVAIDFYRGNSVTQSGSVIAGCLPVK